MKNNRYPGVLPFEESQQLLFYGRSEETEDILHLIKAKDLGVVFAKSGIGKTSLIKAGVMPLLNDEDIYPIEIRFQEQKDNPISLVKATLEPFVNQNLLTQFGSENDKHILWKYLKACEFGKKGFIPLLIFDQFEEYFLHKENAREACSLQFAELLNERLPDDIRRQFRQINRKERTSEQLDWFSPLQVKLLFLIRSDKLSLMDEMSQQMPAILANRYHLQPLKRAAAEKAIIEPALLKDSYLNTQSFDYQENTIAKIIKYLSNKQGEIESSQLQILCQHVETAVAKKQAKNPNVRIKVSTDYLGDMHGILNKYYENKIAELPLQLQAKARQLIEEELIIEDRRIGVDEAVLMKKFAVNQQFLEQLLQTRLIRRERNRLGNSYELSHDTLLKPIAQSREIRQAKEALEQVEQIRIKQEQELAEQKRKLDKERKLKEEAEKQRLIAIKMTGISKKTTLLAEKSALLAKMQEQKALKSAKEAEKQRKKAVRQSYFAVLIAGIAVLFMAVAIFFYLESDKAKAKIERQTQELQTQVDKYNKKEVERRILVVEGLKQNGELQRALARINELLKDEKKILNDSLRSILEMKKEEWQ